MDLIFKTISNCAKSLYSSKSFLPLTQQIKYSFLKKGCLVFIKKGEEIRLCDTLATNPEHLENGAKT